MTWVKEITIYPTKTNSYSYDHIEALSVSADDKFLIGGGNKKAFVWDASSSEIIASTSFRYSINNIVISPNGQFALVATGQIYYWDLTDPGNEPVEFAGGIRGGAVDISQDNRFAAVDKYHDGGVIVWDLESNSEVREFSKRKANFTGISISPDLRYVATTDMKDASINVWEINGRKKPISLKGYSETPQQLHFLDDGRTLVSFARDSEVIFWDLPNKKLTKKYPARNCFTIAKNGEFIAESGEWYVTIRDSEWVKLKEIRSNGFVWRILLGPTGRSLYIASGGSGIIKWVQKEPMDKTVRGILQLTDWIDQAILYFKQFGFFDKSSHLVDDDFVVEVKQSLHEYFYSESTTPPTQFDLIRLIAEDASRVYYGDSEIVNYDTVYTDMMLKWSGISRGSFSPSDINEEWSDDNKSIVLSFSLVGNKYTITPEISGDWIDLSIIDEINKIISLTGYGFYVFDEPYDQSFIIVCLTAEEKNKLEVDLGVSFQHLRAS